MWPVFFSKNRQRRRLLAAAPPGPMREYFSVPFPEKNTPLHEVPIVALDFETSGLDPQQHHLVSIGLVALTSKSIELNTARHQIVYSKHEMTEQSAVIHQITDDTLQQGEDIRHLMPHLLQMLSGKVLLVHHAAIELRFLNQICQRLYQQPFLIPYIDTEILARRRYARRGQPVRSTDLRLFALREKYHLPVSAAHNALNDALGTAELFLALLADIAPQGNVRLADVLCG